MEPTSYLGVQPPGAIRRLGLGRIESIALSSDGTRLAVGTSVGLYLYDALSFELLWFNPSRVYDVVGLSFSLDGSLLAGHEAGRVYVWEVGNGRVIFDQPIETQISPVQVSPDNEQVIAQGNVIHVWSLETGEELGVYDSPSPPGVPIGISPNGDLIAFQTASLQAALLDLYDESIHVLEGDPGYYFVFSPDGRYLASESDEKHQITVWDVEARTSVGTFRVEDRTTPLAFTADGSLLLALSLWDGFNVWDMGAQTLDATISDIYTEGEFSLISPRREVYDVSNHERVNIYDAASGDLDRVLDGFTARLIEDVVVSSDVQQIFVKHSREVAVWNTQTGQPLASFPVDGHYNWAVSPDGRMVAVRTQMGLDVWDVDSGERIVTNEFVDDLYSIAGLAFVDDGATLAVGLGFGGIVLVDVESGLVEPSHFLDLELRAQDRVLVDESSLVAWTDDGPGVWDIDSGQLRYQLPISSFATPLFDISPDEQQVAVYINAGFEGRIEVMDIESGAVLWVVAYKEERADVRQVLYSPDGSLLVTGRIDGSIDILDAQTGDEIIHYQHASLSDLIFAPDGLWLASSSSDGTVILWDVPY